MPFKVKFVETDKIVELDFPNTPKLTDIFYYDNKYQMVVDYDGRYLHVVSVDKHEVTEQSQ